LAAVILHTTSSSPWHRLPWACPALAAASGRAFELQFYDTFWRPQGFPIDAGSLVPLDLQAVTLVSIMQIDHAARTV